METILSILLAFHLLLPSAMIPQVLTTTENGGIAVVSHNYYSAATSCTNGSSPCVFANTITLGNNQTAYVNIIGCGSIGCSVSPTSPGLSDGTNSWNLVTNASYLGNNFHETFVAANTVAGTYTLTWTLDGGQLAYYEVVEYVVWSGANASTPVDSSVSNNATGSSGYNITSMGNVASSGESCVASFSSTGTAPTATGSYSTLDSNGTDKVLYSTLANPSSGSTTTAAASASGNYSATLLCVKP